MATQGATLQASLNIRTGIKILIAEEHMEPHEQEIGDQNASRALYAKGLPLSDLKK